MMTAKPQSLLRSILTRLGLLAIGKIPVVTNATGTGAISTTYAPSAHFQLENVTVHFSSAPTTSENLTITINANDGSDYDTVILSRDPSLTSDTDILFLPESPVLCESGDAIDVAYTNTDGRTFGLRIVATLV